MELVSFHSQIGKLLWSDLDAERVSMVVKLRLDAQPRNGRGVTDQVDDDLPADQWRPRQLLVMWQNIRCSILFHLLVRGGK